MIGRIWLKINEEVVNKFFICWVLFRDSIEFLGFIVVVSCVGEIIRVILFY